MRSSRHSSARDSKFNKKKPQKTTRGGPRESIDSIVEQNRPKKILSTNEDYDEEPTGRSARGAKGTKATAASKVKKQKVTKKGPTT